VNMKNQSALVKNGALAGNVGSTGPSEISSTWAITVVANDRPRASASLGAKATRIHSGPTPPRGAYFVALLEGKPVAMGAHRPLDAFSSEVRRMYTLVSARRTGAARAILGAVEQHARQQGFVELKLETGYKQLPAMLLYESAGFRRIEPFGVYQHDPTSVCFAKALTPP